MSIFSLAGIGTLSLLLAPQASAQLLNDDGQAVARPAGNLGAPVISRAGCGTGLTTTHYLGGNGQAGVCFDIAVGGSDMTIDCMDVNLRIGANPSYDVEIYYCPTTSVGNEGNAAAWTLIENFVGVTPAGLGLPTKLSFTSPAAVNFLAGQSYGIAVINNNGYTAGHGPAYTNGGPLPYAGDDCDITTNAGLISNFGGSFFPREFNGTVYTTAGPAGPGLALACAAGVATADLSGFTANGPIAVVYGSASAYVHGGAQCNGVALDLTPTTAPIIVLADANGDAQIIQGVPASACGSGLLVQAVDGATCVASNSAAL